MKKGFKSYAIAWAILLVLFNIICFTTPNEIDGMTKFGGAFWAGYVFITLAFIGQLICAYFALKAENLTKLFYNLPLITISYTGLILTIIFGSLCMAIPDLPNWIGIIICAIVLAFTAIAVVKAKAVGDIVAATDEKIKDQTEFIRGLTAEAQSLIAYAKTDDAKAACKKVYEALRYSDPRSSNALADTESEISQEFSKFADAVKNGEDFNPLAEKLVLLIGDRNTKCKVMK
jgi:hypothetical protein